MKASRLVSLVALVLVGVAVSGCAGSLGWSRATALPRGSYDEERIERVGPGRSFRSDPCGGYGRASTYEIPAGYELVPMATSTRSPCQ
jgi:hypothetical protein